MPLFILVKPEAANLRVIQTACEIAPVAVFKQEPRHVAQRRTKVAKALADAGYPIEPEALYDGLEVGVACRARTELSKDGRYTNVVALYRRNGVS